MKKEILYIMPKRLRSFMEEALAEDRGLEEIRIRAGQPVELRFAGKSLFLQERMGEDDLEEMLVYISKYSIYACEEELRQGFVTISGGHRVGFAGQIRLEQQRVCTLANIRFLNIRVARQQTGCAGSMISWLYQGEEVQNTLLISLPGVGKTTFLRDCIRLISNGYQGRKGKKVCIVDERSEIAACNRGIPQNDVGIRTDVLDCCPKVQGMGMAVRSLSPEVLAVEEIGSVQDAQAMEQVMLSGCRILGTLHGDCIFQAVKKQGIRRMYEQRLFERYILLKRNEEGERFFEVYDGGLERLW